MPEPTSNQPTHTVWFRLFQHKGGGVLEAAGGIHRVVLSSVSIVADVKNAVWNICENNLHHCGAGDLQVYEPGTVAPTSTDPEALRIEPVTEVKFLTDAKSLLGGIVLGSDKFPPTSDLEPLIVTAPAPALQSSQQEKNSSLVQAFNNLIEEFKKMAFEVHGLREALPTVLVGHVISPSEASKKPQAVATVFDALGLGLAPRKDGSTYHLPDTCGPEWNFSYQWPRDTATEDRILERQSYEPVCNFLKNISLICADVSDGQNCVEGLLFDTDIFTCRNENPHLVHGQKVFHRHRVAGHTDIAVLKAKRRGEILRHMVKFAIELKTVEGYRQSATGCMREAQLQLIGLNAFNTHSSPPVLLSNLANTHQVVYLAKDEDWNYDVAVQNCATFAAAVHFANQKSEEDSISQHFARPNTPQ